MQLFSYRCWVQPQPWLRLQQLSQFLLLNVFSLQALESSLIHMHLLPANNFNFWSTKEEINWLGLNKRVVIIFALVGDTANKWDRPTSWSFFPLAHAIRVRKNWGHGVQAMKWYLPATKQNQLCWVTARQWLQKAVLNGNWGSCSTSPLSGIPVSVPALTARPGRGRRKEIIHFLIRLWKVRSKYHIS